MKTARVSILAAVLASAKTPSVPADFALRAALPNPVTDLSLPFVRNPFPARRTPEQYQKPGIQNYEHIPRA
jgi:hypothetical protein